jgi:hypothetical protein
LSATITRGNDDMSFGAMSSEPWKPLPDDQLSWFRADQKLFLLPRPLDYSLEIYAMVFGLTYALESVEFPLYAVRSRLDRGRVYLAAVPSAVAENNLEQRLANIHDQSIRYTRNIQRAWEQQIKPEVERYNRWFEDAASFTGTGTEFSELLRKLRRARGNQWFVAIRGTIVPTLLLQQKAGDQGAPIVETAGKLTKDALQWVAQGGGELVAAVLRNVGQRLVEDNVIDQAEDVFWLEWLDVRELLQSAADRRPLVAQRKREIGENISVMMPDTLGPALPADAPRTYLLKEVLQLLD